MNIILFVCVHNAGRSQMAEAIFNASASERGLDWRAESAGTLGGGSLNPLAMQALREIGILTDGLYPKALDRQLVDRATKIVGMGCGVDAEACPTKFLLADDWGLDDPAGQPIESVRTIRDQIVQKVEELIARLESDE